MGGGWTKVTAVLEDPAETGPPCPVSFLRSIEIKDSTPRTLVSRCEKGDR